jgi:DNA ligase-1
LLDNGEIAVFSRNSENMSAKYPDLVEQIPRVSQRLDSGAGCD